VPTRMQMEAIRPCSAAMPRKATGVKRAVIRLCSRVVTGIHVLLYCRSAGRIGGRFRGADILLLTLTGRKSGRRWTTPLMYRADGDDLIVAASNGGMDWAPSWWLNLRANPVADVQLGATHYTVRAEPADAAEQARLWPLMNQTWGGFDRYQRRTSRVIPLVKLHPIGALGGEAA
jgi:F420H(2)-dependent quinone reductase